MKAIETTGKISKEGNLLLDHPLKIKGKNVKVIILMEEDEEHEWISAVSSNPAFDFLKDEREDIYKVTDGQPLND